MASVQAPLYSAAGEAQGQFDLPEVIFSAPGSRRVLQEVIVALQANQRRGTSSTKTRGEVSGGGHKPWKQKHTGNARAGSIRSPLWRKGGIIFGPEPRSYVQRLPATKRLAALRAVLQSAFGSGNLRIVDSFKVQEPKTKLVVEALNKLG